VAHGQITVALLTIAGSGVVSSVASAVVNYKLNTQKAHQDIQRQKLEEMFTAVQNFGTSFGSVMLPYLSAMIGNTTYDKALDLALEVKHDDVTASRKCLMLIALYFPTVRSTWQVWDQTRGQAINVLQEFRDRRRRGESGRDLAEPYIQALKEFELIQRKVESELAALAPSLLRPEPLIAWRQAWHWLSTNIKQRRKASSTTS
jgi:hypothetical protein